jgi:hypothetical protein
MVDPMSLTVAGLVAKAALEGVGDEAGRGAWSALGRVLVALRHRFAGDESASQALAAVQQSPNDQSRVSELATAVQERAEADAAFRSELEALVSEAKRDPMAGQFVTEVYGNAQVGKLVNIGQARDVSF